MSSPKIKAEKVKRVTVQLSEPIMVENQEVASLTLRRPKAGDLIVTDHAKGDMGKTFALLERLTATPESSLRELEMEDFAELSEKLADFLPDSLRTGALASRPSRGDSKPNPAN